MPEYLAPGVYVEERDTGAKPIEGVSTTTSGMVGVTERGPVGVPTLVIGSPDFQRQFGGLLDRDIYTGSTSYLPHSVHGFFKNGGKRLYVVRVLPDDADTAVSTLFDRGAVGGVSTELAVPASVGDLSLVLADSSSVLAGQWLRLEDEEATEYVQVLTTNGAAMTARGGFRFDHGAGSTVRVFTVSPTPTGSQTTALAGASQFTTTPALVANQGDSVAIGTGPDREFVEVASADAITGDVTFQPPLARDHAALTDIFAATLDIETILTTPADAGDHLFTIADATGLTGSEVIEVGGGGGTEAVGVDQALEVTTGASLPHGVGTAVQLLMPTLGTPLTLPAISTNQDEITFNPAPAVAVGDFLAVDSGALLEIRRISAVNGSTVTLREALSFSHPTTPTVTPVTLFQGQAGTETTLVSNLAAGGTRFLAEDTSDVLYAPNAILELAGGDEDEVEYLVVNSRTVFPAITTGIPARSDPAVPVPLQRIHASGIAVLGRGPLIAVQAIDAGGWGNDLEVTVEEDDSILSTAANGWANAGDLNLTLRSAVGIEPGTILEIRDDAAATPWLQKAESVSGSRVAFSGGLSFAVPDKALVRTREFKMTVRLVQINPANNKPRVVENETHRRLSMDPRHSRYFAKVIGPIFDGDDAITPREADGRTQGESDLIRVRDVLADITGALTGTALASAQNDMRLGPDLIIDTLPDGRIVPVAVPLDGGDDAIGAVTDDTYIGTDDVNPKNRTGLAALKNIDEISIVAIPGQTSQKVQQAVIEHCELLRYRFAVIDSGIDQGMAEVQEHRSLYDTKYAALYHPWLRIDDPFPDNPRVGSQISIPPSGHVMGIYARSDIERGVHKAPANEVIRGVAGLETKLLKEQQDILNPRQIDVLRDFRDVNRGFRVWGARTLSSDPDWKYVNVRRLFIFIEASIDRGTQWVVFEPNSELLWERVRRVVSMFLQGVWRDGALMGLKPEEAYYVKCDRTTMTQNDIDNGRLIVEIGIAPVKPAEFVIFRIGQWTGGANTDGE